MAELQVVVPLIRYTRDGVRSYAYAGQVVDLPDAEAERLQQIGHVREPQLAEPVEVNADRLSEMSVEEVETYLVDHTSDIERVVGMEREGKARKGILSLG